jgi:DNA-binding LytR/AlgR family response regulator
VGHALRIRELLFIEVGATATKNELILIPKNLGLLSREKIHVAFAKLVEMNRYIDEENYVSLGNEKQNLIHFHDDKGTLRLSIKFSKLYYIEAADNYVNIYYENKGKISRFLLRKSLKSIEDTYKEYPLIRCHRSYIINVDKVKVLKKEKDGTYLDFDYGEINVIPVSKTYSQNIIDIFY